MSAPSLPHRGESTARWPMWLWLVSAGLAVLHVFVVGLRFERAFGSPRPVLTASLLWTAGVVAAVCLGAAAAARGGWSPMWSRVAGTAMLGYLMLGIGLEAFSGPFETFPEGGFTNELRPYEGR